ncbi:MAG: hypothetical protein JXA89_08660 [Anaerolineae bacterium]|nr:hypothetical protein [Anaerolineae bacterium]
MGLVAARIWVKSQPAEALTWAAAVTSLKLEEEGPFNRDIAEVETLYKKLSAHPDLARRG